MGIDGMKRRTALTLSTKIRERQDIGRRIVMSHGCHRKNAPSRSLLDIEQNELLNAGFFSFHFVYFIFFSSARLLTINCAQIIFRRRPVKDGQQQRRVKTEPKKTQSPVIFFTFTRFFFFVNIFFLLGGGATTICKGNPPFCRAFSRVH